MNTYDVFFRPKRSSSSLPLFDRSLLGDAACFGPDSDGFMLYVTDEAVEALRTGTQKEAPREAFGILLGRSYEDAQGIFTIVSYVVYAKDFDAGSGHVHLDPLQMADLRRTASRLYPTTLFIGWTHSHQRRSEYSSTDRDEQKKLDNHQVGILTFMHCSKDEPWAVAYRGPDSRNLLLKGPSVMTISDDQTFIPKPGQGDGRLPREMPDKNMAPQRKRGRFILLYYSNFVIFICIVQLIIVMLLFILILR